MAKDPFLLVNLGESESKTLAQVISNDTARKILDLLSRQDSATESDVAKALKVPLSTVHYNLQALVKANLVQTEEFHYSQKGKEILHYSLANKLIIIAPKNMDPDSFRDKLKSILPVAAIGIGAAAVLELVSIFSSRVFSSSSASIEAPQMMKAVMAPEAIGVAAPMAASRASDSVAAGGAAASQGAPAAAHAFTLEPVVALWFLAGVLFTSVVLALWFYVKSKRKSAKQ